MSIEEICLRLSQQDEVETNLDILGTALRDESARKLSYVNESIPFVLNLFTDHPMEVLRVLINYTADNSENRLQLLEATKELRQFWNNALKFSSVDNGISDLASRFMILITQFVRAPDEEKKQFLPKLEEKGMIDWVWKFYGACIATDLDSIDNAIEVLTIFVQLFPQSLKQLEIELIMKGINGLLSMEFDEDIEEAVLFHTQFLVNVTNVEDSQLLIPINDMISCISKMPDNLKSSLPMKKNLFAACGNVFSFPSFDNFKYMEFSVPIILAGSNLYATAAAAISLGNCVLDKGSQTRVIEKIDSISSLETVGKCLLHHTYGDVIQLQAFHFFNNCMNERLATHLLQEDSAFALYKNTKMMVDNYKYYEQIGQIYLRFLSKLVKLGFLSNIENDVTLFSETWDYLENLEQYCEAKMLILQAVCKSKKRPMPKELTILLISDLTKLKSTGLDAQELLTKLKTLAVLFQGTDVKDLQEIYSGSKFQDQFLNQLENFFKQVLLIVGETTSQEANTNLIQGAVTNNCRFIAAAAIEKFLSLEADFQSIARIKEICLGIVREPQYRGDTIPMQ